LAFLWEYKKEYVMKNGNGSEIECARIDYIMTYTRTTWGIIIMPILEEHWWIRGCMFS